MARLSQSFTSVETDVIAGPRIYREARLGQREVVETPNIGDAFKAVTAVQRMREAYESQKEVNPLVRALASAWAVRHD